MAALVAGSLLAQDHTAPDRTAELRARFQKELDPVHKARMVASLADAEFRDMHAKIDEGDLSGAAEIAGQVRDEAQASKKALDAKIHDPEAHPDGYKQLEISVRESVRRLDDILVGLAKDEQNPLMQVRTELDELERQIIHQLFPKRPGPVPAPESAPANEKPKS